MTHPKQLTTYWGGLADSTDTETKSNTNTTILQQPENVLPATQYIENDVEIGEGGFIGAFVVIRNDTVIGDSVCIGHNTTIEEGVTIGHGVRIQANCYITKGTVIENDVFIGPCFTSLNDLFICSHGRPEKSHLRAPVIREYARIGGGTTIGPEVEIGEQAFIGCGSLVLKDVPGFEMWYGRPAKFVRLVPDDELI